MIIRDPAKLFVIRQRNDDDCQF